MIINGFQKLTLVDYPNIISAIIFTQGCNYKCSFCQNSGLIKLSCDSLIDPNEVLNYLEKRKNVLEGIVISGGEPTIQSDLIEFIKKIKDLGYLVKLDTNGSNPNVIAKLLDNNLIDYIAMDIKNIFADYDVITNTKTNILNVKKSAELIKNSKIKHEFRTTIMKNYHDINKIEKIAEYLGKNEKYFLQNFEDSEMVLDKKLISWTKEELIDLENKLIIKYPNLKIRGI